MDAAPARFGDRARDRVTGQRMPELVDLLLRRRALEELGLDRRGEVLAGILLGAAREIHENLVPEGYGGDRSGLEQIGDGAPALFDKTSEAHLDGIPYGPWQGEVLGPRARVVDRRLQ